MNKPTSTPSMLPCCPIETLPDEIVIMILVNTQDSTDSHERHRFIPTIALLVCHRWNQVARNTPLLWKHLWLSDTLLDDYELFTQILHRARNIALNIVLPSYIVGRPLSLPEKRLPNRTERLNPLICRLKEVCITSYLKPVPVTSKYKSPPLAYLPSYSLTIEFGMITKTAWPPSAPFLQTLVLYDTIWQKSHTTSPTFPVLTTLVLERSCPRQVVDHCILIDPLICPVLKVLYLHGLPFTKRLIDNVGAHTPVEGVAPVRNSPVLLNRLEELHVSGLEHKQILAFFRAFEMPSLVKLDLGRAVCEDSTLGRRTSPEDFKAFQFPNLTHLALDDIHSTYTHFLYNHPSLLHLALCPPSLNLIPAFVSERDSDLPVLPNLTTFVVEGLSPSCVRVVIGALKSPLSCLYMHVRNAGVGQDFPDEVGGKQRADHEVRKEWARDMEDGWKCLKRATTVKLYGEHEEHRPTFKSWEDFERGEPLLGVDVDEALLWLPGRRWD